VISSILEKGNSLDELVVIEIFGEEYRFRPDSQVENPEQVVQHLIKYIKESEALFQNRPSDKNKIIILLLSAMNLSRDFHELKVKYSELEKETEKRVSSILEKIDQEFEKNTNFKLL
jgi:cell division protein ZapA (FtsZ GTPase activity inhibitor)